MANNNHTAQVLFLLLAAWAFSMAAVQVMLWPAATELSAAFGLELHWIVKSGALLGLSAYYAVLIGTIVKRGF